MKKEKTHMALKRVVDNLGHLRAQIADLKEQEEELKAILLSSGLTELDGKLFRATISPSSKSYLDTDRLRKKYGESWMNRYTLRTAYTAIRVVARKVA